MEADSRRSFWLLPLLFSARLMPCTSLRFNEAIKRTCTFDSMGEDFKQQNQERVLCGITNVLFLHGQALFSSPLFSTEALSCLHCRFLSRWSSHTASGRRRLVLHGRQMSELRFSPWTCKPMFMLMLAGR